MNHLAAVSEILLHDIRIILQVGSQLEAVGLNLSQDVDFFSDHLVLALLHCR